MFNPEALGIPAQTKISIAWIDLEESEAKRRMEKRADPRDQWKLAHWDEYVKRRIDPPQHSSIQCFDNLSFDQENFDKLINHLIK
jgi:polyphosphate kinase 2 (PPK2 family)